MHMFPQRDQANAPRHRRPSQVLRLVTVLVIVTLIIAGVGIFSSRGTPKAHAAFASPTSSSVISHPTGRHVFWKPGHLPATHAHAAAANNLAYNGGSVMAETTNIYAIFWEPNGQVSANYHALIERYFHDVGGSPLYQNNTQYTQSSGGSPTNSRLAGSWTDTGGYPNSPLLDADIQQEVSHAMAVNGWSASSDNAFFVFTQSGADLCFDSSHSSCASNAFCAYHSAFGNGVIYAAMPYAASFHCGSGMKLPNNDDAALTINVTSHEQMEAATDPYPSSGWVDANGQEIGDKCAWNFGSVNGDGSNVSWNGDHYLVQQEWDNAMSGCTLVATGGGGTYYKIINRNSGQALDISGLSTATGGPAIQWPYSAGANQQWQEVPANGGYKLINRNSGLLLDDPGYSTTNGTQLDQWSDTNGSNQWWNLVSAGNGYYYLVNQSSGLYADVSGGSTANGATVLQWPGNGGANQQWQVSAV